MAADLVGRLAAGLVGNDVPSRITIYPAKALSTSIINNTLDKAHPNN
jgi:hypothetical protein